MVGTDQFKGGEFVIKDYSFENTVYPEVFTEDHQMIRATVRDFVNGEVIPLGGKIEHQVELMRKAGELGLLGAHIPAAYGGGEMDFISHSLISEELGKLCWINIYYFHVSF